MRLDKMRSVEIIWNQKRPDEIKLDQIRLNGIDLDQIRYEQIICNQKGSDGVRSHQIRGENINKMWSDKKI